MQACPEQSEGKNPNDRFRASPPESQILHSPARCVVAQNDFSTKMLLSDYQGFQLDSPSRQIHTLDPWASPLVLPILYLTGERGALTLVKREVWNRWSLSRFWKRSKTDRISESKSGLGHLFGLAKESLIHRHSAALATLEAEVVDPVLAEFGWFKTLGATPVSPGQPTLDLTDAIRSERYRAAPGTYEGVGFAGKGHMCFGLLGHRVISILTRSRDSRPNVHLAIRPL